MEITAMNKETTMVSEETIAAMKSLGREWTKDDYHRIYFDDLPALYGLSVSRYNSGNISGASLDGERISNGAAGRILAALDGKLYYDLADGKYHGKGIDPDHFRPLVTAIKAKVAAIVAGTDTPAEGLEESA
jgi:hypothetical protein